MAGGKKVSTTPVSLGNRCFLAGSGRRSWQRPGRIFREEQDLFTREAGHLIHPCLPTALLLQYSRHDGVFTQPRARFGAATPPVMKKCAYCGRENADDAGQCGECGTALATEGASPASQLAAPENPARTLAERRMLFGALWCIGGVFVTAITYMAASGPGGGTYIVAWGAIVFGGIQFFRGLTGKDERPGVEDVGYDALDYATSLERQGRVQEAVAVYQKIVESYSDTAAGRDAQKSLESLKAKLG